MLRSTQFQFSALTSSILQQYSDALTGSVRLAIASVVFAISFQVSHAQFVYNAQFGTAGAGNGQFSQPNGVAVNPANDNIYVADRNNERVQVFNTSGVFQFQFGTLGSGNGQFASNNGAINLDFDGGGNVWIVDRGNSRIQQFTSAGVYVSQFGSTGSGPGQFSQPNGIAVHPTNGNLYVADRNNERIQVFNSAGTYLFEFGAIGSGNGQFASNNGAVDLVFDTNTGNLWVVDRGNSRVQEFTDAGVYQSQFGSAGTASGQFNQANSIEFNATTNHLYVADRNNERIQVFNTSGVFQYEFGTIGTGNGQFASNNGVVDMALGTSNGDLWVVDRANSRIQHFQDPVILPVELINFHYIRKGNDGIQLLWETLSEWNNSHFIIQGSSFDDPESWKNLATINGIGYSNTRNQYNWIDNERDEFYRYYRIKQVDFDGNHSYSEIISITEEAYSSKVAIYPNPTSDFVHIQVKPNEYDATSAYSISVYDQQGSCLATQKILLQQNEIHCTIPVQQLSNGTYSLILKNGKGTKQIIGQFLKMH